MKLPQGATDGEEFDITARCKMEDGKMCVKSVNGIPMPKEDGDADESSKGMGMEKMKNMKPSEAAMMGMDE